MRPADVVKTPAHFLLPALRQIEALDLRNWFAFAPVPVATAFATTCDSSLTQLKTALQSQSSASCREPQQSISSACPTVKHSRFAVCSMSLLPKTEIIRIFFDLCKRFFACCFAHFAAGAVAWAAVLTCKTFLTCRFQAACLRHCRWACCLFALRNQEDRRFSGWTLAGSAKNFRGK